MEFRFLCRRIDLGHRFAGFNSQNDQGNWKTRFETISSDYRYTIEHGSPVCPQSEFITLVWKCFSLDQIDLVAVVPTVDQLVKWREQQNQTSISDIAGCWMATWGSTLVLPESLRSLRDHFIPLNHDVCCQDTSLVVCYPFQHKQIYGEWNRLSQNLVFADSAAALWSG